MSDPPGRGDAGRAVMQIPVTLQVVLGSTVMPVAELMALGRGAVVTLDRKVGDPIDLVVNGRLVARGEIVVVEDDSQRFGIALTDVVGHDGTVPA